MERVKSSGILEVHAEKAYGFWYNHNVILPDGTVDLEKSRSMRAWFSYGGNLTERKLLLFGHQAYNWFMAQINREPQIGSTWDDAPVTQQLAWCDSRGGKVRGLNLTIDYARRDVSYSHDMGSGSHALADTYRGGEGWLS